MPVTKFENPDKYGYLHGLGTYDESQSVPKALPEACNSPPKCPLVLYAEKLSGTAFTAPRHQNQQSWLYRILPSAAHGGFARHKPEGSDTTAIGTQRNFIPDQSRWSPFDVDKETNWVDGRKLVAGGGSPVKKTGLSIFIFSAGKDMEERSAFYSADGDLLIVAQQGSLEIQTEFGRLLVRPFEIAVIPRGIRHRVTLPHGPARGYILELYQGHFALPELGPIGSNGLANERDFQIPTSFYEKTHRALGASSTNSTMYSSSQPKVTRRRFNTIGSVSYDHSDSSIFTVLTAPSGTPGVAVADLVIFPPRWLVQEDTFRPPWFHRNTMSEFMGLIDGDYDAK
ncbi:Fc.00g095010.m01.CDS01 [Cosmosporella sp. VM-42]